MLNSLLIAIAIAVLFLALCYVLAYAIAYPIMRYRERKWERERIQRLKVFRQQQKDFVL